MLAAACLFFCLEDVLFLSSHVSLVSYIVLEIPVFLFSVFSLLLSFAYSRPPHDGLINFPLGALNTTIHTTRYTLDPGHCRVSPAARSLGGYEPLAERNGPPSKATTTARTCISPIAICKGGATQ